MIMRAKTDMMEELETMLHDLFAAKEVGVVAARLARAHGYVDGYMRALLELDVATNDELLSLVARERANVAGPATRETNTEDRSAGAVA
jgi:hypothetical protein